MKWMHEKFLDAHMMRTEYGEEKSVVLSITEVGSGVFFLLGSESGKPNLFPDAETPIGFQTPFGRHIIHHSVHDTFDDALLEATTKVQPMVKQTLLSMEN